jgi:dTDP-4-amino-4,6-dideoxygalactose transaminase
MRSSAEAQSLLALPALTCFDVATAAVGADMRVALYDLDPQTLGPDLDSLESSLRTGVRAVVVAPLYGMPVDWGAVEDLAAPYGAMVVEDAAQGHGAFWRGRPVGALGALSVVSFGRGKGWTGGGGGALLVRRAAPIAHTAAEPPTANFIDELGVVLRVLAQCALGRPAVYGVPAGIPLTGLGETRYHHPRLPRGMCRATAALLDATCQAADQEATTRRANGEAFSSSIRYDRGVMPVLRCAGAVPGFLRFPVRLSRGMAGFRDPGQAVRLGVVPTYPAVLADLPPIRTRLSPSSSRWPGAEELVRQLVTLPTHSLQTAQERDQILRSLHDYSGPPR